MADTKRRQNPRATSNFLSSIFILDMIPVFYASFKKDLTEDDLFEALDEHKSSLLGEQLEIAWKHYHKKYKRFCLHFAILRVFGFELFMHGMLAFAKELIAILFLPYLIGKLVEFYSKPYDQIPFKESYDGYYYAVGLLTALFVERIIAHPMYLWTMHVGMKMRLACNSLIYRKMLRLSKTAMAQTTIGHVINLASNDVGKFDSALPLVHYSWVAPIQVVIALYFLYLRIGIACFFGIGVLIVLLPIQTFIARRTMVLRLRTALRTDERVRLMNEIISGIQVIKMYVWEKSFAKLVAQVRRKELKAIRANKYLKALTYAIETVGTRFGIFISLIAYVLLGNQISAQIAFEVTAVYNVLKTPFTYLFTTGLSEMAVVNVSVKRIKQFLDLEETPVKLLTLKLSSNKKLDGAKIILKSLHASWQTDDTLSNISLKLEKPQLLIIVGSVGCGKSSLLNVLLSELPPKAGTAEIDGRISYCAQEPWLFSGSIRKNILFGDAFDEKRYRRICKVCALEDDFRQLPYGDKTLVGERGRALSGGQKARINLARAIYKQADIYLLDDPLSAVDTHVGETLFKHCIRTFLRDKIVVLVTHQLQFLTEADQVLLLRDGRVAAYGDYNSVHGLELTQPVEQVEEENNENKESFDKKFLSRQISVKSGTSEIGDSNENTAEDPILEKETITLGKVTFSTYKQYFKTGGSNFLIFIGFSAFILSEALTKIGDYFLVFWVERENEFAEAKFDSNSSNYMTNFTQATPPDIDADRLILVAEYTGIMILVVISAVVCNIFAFYYLLRASSNLHNVIFDQLTKAKLHFFNSNPIGRILNKFSMDIGIIDDLLLNCSIEFLRMALLLFGTLVLTSVVNIMLIPAALALLVVFYLMRIVYVGTSRNVKRIEAVARSPVYNKITTSLNGLSTIRAFSGQQIAIEEFEHSLDSHSSAFFLFLTATRAFGFWLDLLCVIFLAIVTACILILQQDDHQGMTLGLVITQYMGLLGALQWGMRQWSEMENLMTSVERVLEYTHLDNEPLRLTDGKLLLPTNWPDAGKLEFQNVSMRYAPNSEPVLKSINFTANSGEKIGIVGRTGAGKSSIINALFQFYDLEGAIFIDNVNIIELPLTMVRTKVSIIPQDSILFCGTMRKNLDPFDEYSDEVLWNALELVELKAIIAETPHGLHTSIAEEGANYSVGQRQLICLARAIIRKNKILVLDEVTANVDQQTDALIQKTLREHFASCTVLTIAHRLNSIIDYDKILVMDAGKVIEYDTVANLLQIEDGVFKNMVETSGIDVGGILSNANKNE